MNKHWFFKAMLLSAALALVLSACGAGQPATADELPVYPGATRLQPGEDPVADTLAKNMEQNAALTQSMGVGGKLEQGAFRLPADASWDQVKAFYDEQLKGQGWAQGLSGPAGQAAQQALEMTNAGSEAIKIAMYNQGKQTLTIMRLLETPSATQPYLIYSLNSN